MALITVYCQPGARQTAVSGLHDGLIKIKVCAPPVDGAANRELKRFLSAKLDVAESRITLTCGEKSRIKQFDIPAHTVEAMMAILNPAND